ncbi:MAG: peptidylprolyl isomerase [Chloroflexota bacterium]
MAKKKAQKPTTPPPMTKKQLSRWQKEQRQELLAKVFVAVVVALLIGVLGFGYFREFVAKPNEAILSVNGTAISLGTYAKILTYRRWELTLQMARLQELVGRYAGDDPEYAMMRQLVTQQLQQVQGQLYLVNTQLPDELIVNELIRQEARHRNIAVGTEEVTKEITDRFQPTPAEPVTTTTGTPTPTPIPANKWQENYKNYLADARISDSEYRQWNVEPLLYRDKLREAMGATIPKVAEQVRARHILMKEEDKAKEVLAKLQSGASFEALAKEYSTDESNKDKGGDLGWFPRGHMVPEFESAAFSLAPGQLSQVISTTFGFHIIKLDEKDPNHPLADEDWESMKDQAFAQWLDQQMKSPQVKRYLDSPKMLWASDQADKAIKARQAEPQRRSTQR